LHQQPDVIRALNLFRFVPQADSCTAPNVLIQSPRRRGRPNALLHEQRFVDRLATMNVEAAPPRPPERPRELMQSELARWTKLAREADIQVALQ
jgi:hypothetical protein